MYNRFVQNIKHKGAVVRLSLFLSVLCGLIVFSGCEKNITDGAFLFDTYVSVTADQHTAERLLAVLSVLSEDIGKCYDTPADELDSPVIDDMVFLTDSLRERYGVYDSIDLRIGALTRAWGISTDTPRVPEAEEIAKLVVDKSYLDPGAVAKGYALDCAYQTLSDTETADKCGYAVVSMESSVLLFGEKPDGKPFQTGIKSPFNDYPENGGYIGYIETGAVFISTSGGYERFFEADGKAYIHIIDTKTGYPIETDLASVTVIVPAETENGGILSDFLSTLIIMQGTAELDTFLADEDYNIIAVDEVGTVYKDCELKAIS
jgi:thiamine biosynthesis lipoprotein